MARRYTIKSQTFEAPPLEAGLYCVATPIGNLGDITLRALETLAAADVVACEDTRTSGVLLSRYGIDRPKVSYNEHNADRRGPDLLRQIAEGAAVALISDAGTPLVSDPGHRLVVEAIAAGLRVVPLPGASAPLAALVGSGFDPAQFGFCGFLPAKAAARKTALQEFADAPETLVFFESPARLVKSLVAMAEIFGNDRQAVVARELTKMHETFHRGTLESLAEEFGAMDKVRGEIVVVVERAGARDVDPKDVTAMLRDALMTMKTRDAAAFVAERTGVSRSALYAKALALKDEM